MMNRYTLMARLGSQTSAVMFNADDDTEATLLAIDTIMERAYQQDNAWAKGSIELVSPTGEVLQTMGAK
jgi:hypothetical protein